MQNIYGHLRHNIRVNGRQKKYGNIQFVGRRQKGDNGMKYETFEDLYSYEALNIAKNILKDGESVTITKNKNKNIIDISSENPDKIFKELMNEALNQQCRIDISKKNFKVSQMIITKALVSALGEEPKSKKRGRK